MIVVEENNCSLFINVNRSNENDEVGLVVELVVVPKLNLEVEEEPVDFPNKLILC